MKAVYLLPIMTGLTLIVGNKHLARQLRAWQQWQRLEVTAEERTPTSLSVREEVHQHFGKERDEAEAFYQTMYKVLGIIALAFGVLGLLGFLNLR